jgi:hypothetical protein
MNEQKPLVPFPPYFEDVGPDCPFYTKDGKFLLDEWEKYIAKDSVLANARKAGDRADEK